MKNIEIKIGKIAGTLDKRGDYKAPKFDNGDFLAEDPRSWLKDDDRARKPSAPTNRCDIAVRVENGGLLFLVWYRGVQAGVREGDGCFLYIFTPFGAECIEQFPGFLKWCKDTLCSRGTILESELQKWTSYVGDWGQYPQLSISPRSGKYAYINCERPQGSTFDFVVKKCYQKIFSKYCWVLLSDQNARDSFKDNVEVEDITDRLESYCYWNPQNVKNGDWRPQLWMNGNRVEPNSIIFDDKNTRYQIGWESSDPKLRYPKREDVAYRDLASGRIEGLFRQPLICEAHTLPLKGNPDDIKEALEYNDGKGGLPIEYIPNDKRYVVFLPKGNSDFPLNNVSIKKGKAAYFELVKTGNEITLKRRPQQVVSVILDGKHKICEFEDGEIINKSCFRDSLRGKDDNNKRVDIYRLKTKVSIPLFVVCVVAAFLMGAAAGFFGGKYVTEKPDLNTEHYVNTDSLLNELKSQKKEKNGVSDSTQEEKQEQKNKGGDSGKSILPDDAKQNVNSQNTEFVVTVTANSEEGSVTLNGTTGKEVSMKVSKNGTVCISAAAKNSFTFKKWNDGVTKNSRTVKITSDTIYKAIFSDKNNNTI